MSLFEITPDIQRMALPVAPGWYPLELTKIDDKINEGPVDPDDPGMNKSTIFTHNIFDGKEKGRFIWMNVSHSKERLHYSLFYIKFQLGTRKLDPNKKEAITLTVDNAAHKKFEAYIENKTDKEGNVRNQITKVRVFGAKK